MDEEAMSDAVITAIIAAVPPTLLAGLALLKAGKVEKAVNEVHLSVNSRLDEFLKVTKTASHAEGVKEEKDKQENKTP